MVVWIPIAFAALRSFTTKRCCISGSPPLIVKPPDITFRPCRYFLSSAVACATVTGMPLLMVHVSGLWQYKHRHMHPAVHATTRTPGPSTADPVVNEWRNPMSPVLSAVRTSDSGTFFPRFTRSSYGLFAASEAASLVLPSAMAWLSVECAIDDVHLLLTSEPDEVDRVARDTDGQRRVLLGMIHRVDQRLAVEHVHVHVIARAPEERVEDAREVRDAIRFDPSETRGHKRRGKGNAIGRVAIGDFSHRSCRRVNAVAIASVHRIRPGRERLPMPAPVGSVAGRLAVHHVGRNRQNRLRMERVP